MSDRANEEIDARQVRIDAFNGAVPDPHRFRCFHQTPR
tara:strand:- start:347 stop:460 length:114 start_codon:yes stop_codon:yes gene_type:complete